MTPGGVPVWLNDRAISTACHAPKGRPPTIRPGGNDQHFRIRGYQHACYWVDDVDAVMAELRARRVEAFLPATDFPAGAARRVAFVKDPKGNVIEFAGPLLGSG